MKNFYFFLKVGYTVMLVLALAGAHTLPAAAQSCPSSGTTNLSSFSNTYYPATQASATAGSTSITLGAASSGSTAISSGDMLLIIQMQGAQINSANTFNYGGNNGAANGYTNNSQLLAGNMEYVVATNTVPIGGGTLNLSSGLKNSYKNAAYGTDGQYTYQIVRVPIYYNLKLTSTITAPRWNGTSGGVIVLYATNTINFNNQTVDASGMGFRGGGGRMLWGASGSGASSDYATNAVMSANGSKGEGLAGAPKYTNNSSTSSMDTASVEGYPGGSMAAGAPGNAGGGGTDGNPAGSNDQNTGGGGGGNGGAGGRGGKAWSSGTASGGRGGAAFTQASASRLVMGGGGGAGTTNNGTGTPGNGFASSGAAGGGIVIIIAGNSFSGNGTVLANGADASSSVQNDGSGGGGAGGSILIFSNNWNTSSITAHADGGNGGSNETGGGDSHGPGGGGGGGVIYSNSSLNTASSSNAGSAGMTSKNTTTYGASGGNTGSLTTNMPSYSMAQPAVQCFVLPVNFLSFTAVEKSNGVLLSWEVTQATNAREYTIERSTDGSNFMIIGGTAAPITQYNDNNLPANSSVVYYRIRETDADGASIYSKVVSVQLSGANPNNKLSVYPNPASSSVTVNFTCSNAAAVSLRLFDLKGSQVWLQQYSARAGQNTIQIDYIRSLAPGVYILQWFDGLKPEQTKVLVNR